MGDTITTHGKNSPVTQAKNHSTAISFMGEMENSDAKKLADMIKEVRKHLDVLSPAECEEVNELVDTIEDEAKKEKPRRGTLKSIKETLIKITKNPTTSKLLSEAIIKLVSWKLFT